MLVVANLIELLSDLHLASVDVDLVANLIELLDAHVVGCQPRDEVDSFERMGLTIIAHEHGSTTALDSFHQVVTEMHGAEQHHVELHECRLIASHVVGHPSI
jgi:hypothetical protein